jgi:hypothetical protein
MPNAQDELKRLNNMILMTFTPEEGLVTNYTGYTDPNVAWSPPENTVKPGFEIEPIREPEPLPHDPMDAHWQALIAERDKLKAEATCFFEEGIKRGADNAKLKEEVERLKGPEGGGRRWLVERVSELERALGKYQNCRHGTPDCPCTKDSRAALSRTSEEA